VSTKKLHALLLFSVFCFGDWSANSSVSDGRVYQIIFSRSVKEYKDMIETLKLKEFEKECIITLPEGYI